MTNEEMRKAIEKYQVEHPLHFGTMLDVTAISSKEGADIISQTIEQISNKVNEDTELWCICEMAKMYMQGVKPVYPLRSQGEWLPIEDEDFVVKCSVCGVESFKTPFCPRCGADMRGKESTPWHEKMDEAAWDKWNTTEKREALDNG